MEYCFLAEPDKCGAEQEAEMSSNESCYDAMKLCLDKFVTADRKLLQCLNSHCRLYRSVSALILPGLTLCLLSASCSVSLVFIVLYVF